MSAPIMNIWYSENKHKKAECKGCYDKLIFGCKILSVSRSQGKFISVSNYCSKCAEKELQSIMDEMMPIVQNIINIQQELDVEKNMASKVEDCFNKAVEKYGTTLQKLADN